MQWTLNSDSWTCSNYQMSASDCCWHWQDIVLSAGAIYLLPILQSVYMMQAAIYSACNFITILSQSTVHCYMLRTSTLAKTPPLVHFCPHWAISACAGSGVVRIDQLCFLAGCRKKQLNQALSVLSLSLGFLWLYVVLLTRGYFYFVLFYVICVFCRLVVLVRLSVPVQAVDWKDSSPNWPIICWWGR